ncbi:lamin-like protein [Vigna unguiculata]|uniref:Cupredoxin n=1 Tax=Vigna unguiculata TaxID=3917 RepID=A0A4D6LW29_VIGUN|nr:lamin-like protein [Vigna unguiculata]QCD92650.1 Cupredoxin [Vigna unguiculata]
MTIRKDVTVAAATVASVVVMGWLSLVVMGNPMLHKVGGSKGWINHDVNYTQWSAQQHVYVGDWLLFKFDKRYFNVLEVNETSYENCIDRDFISNVTRGGRDVVQMTEARTYYYLSGGGYCFHGMKVAVNVQQLPAMAPAPSSMAVSSSLLPSLMCSCIWTILVNVLCFLNLVFIDGF